MKELIIKLSTSLVLVMFNISLSAQIGNKSQIKDEPKFVVVEENATFNGGDIRVFYNYIQSKIDYSKINSLKSTELRTFISFVVNANGQIENIKVMKSSSDSIFDNEAVRQISLSPIWIPARNQGKPTSQQFTIPIIYKFDNK